MANAWARDRARDFYLAFAAMALSAVLIGFSTTYFLPAARGALGIPWVVHGHGWLAMGWIALLITQVLLVRTGRTRWHRRLGSLAVPLAIGIWASGLAVARWVVTRDMPEQGNFAFASMAGTAISLTMFVAVTVAALLLRRRPDWHKRLILLATIMLLWPAFFRFRHLLPFVPRPEITLALLLADFPILIAAIRDRVRFGRVHPAWKWVGSAVFAEQALELWAFESGITAGMGKWLYGLLT